MATTTKKRAKKPAKTAVKKAAKKAAPTLKQLLVRTQKVQAQLTELIALMRRLTGSRKVVISTDLESNGGAKLIKTL
ncbi:MAG: hypothetical protein ABIQ06_10665 [Caldimonas sp.]